MLREKGSGTRQVFEDALRSRGIDPAALDVVMELPSNEAVRSIVEAGAGVTAISKLVVADKVSAGTLAELPLRCGDRRYLALRHGDRHRGRAESVLLDMMNQHCVHERPRTRFRESSIKFACETHKINQFHK